MVANLRQMSILLPKEILTPTSGLLSLTEIALCYSLGLGGFFYFFIFAFNLKKCYIFFNKQNPIS